MKTLFLAASILFFTGYSSHLISQTPTEGEMTFTVRTVTVNGNFSPKHVLAIWVEDSNGFVLSRKLRAVKRKEYLYTWNTQSGGNVVDAVTGETLLSHQTHTVTWDCKDVNGNLVPDGQYTVYVEFTEAHEQGPLRGIVFTKGSEPVSLTPVDDPNFKDLALSFEPVITVTAAYTFVAEDLTVTFTNTSTEATSYSWDFGDGNSSTEENPVHTYTDAGTYAVILTAESSSSSATYQESVTVSSPVEVSAAYTFVAENLTVTFTNTSTEATSYSWDFGDGNSSTEENPVHTYVDAGTYAVILTAESSSSSATHQESVTVSAPVEVSAAYTFVAEDLTVTFTNTSTEATSYSWDFGDGNSSTEENPVHTYTDAGTYAVILTAESSSSSATYQESVTVSSPVGISDSYATVPQVYPNPTSGIVMINLDGQTGSSTIKIFNLGGSLLYSEQKYNPGIHMVNISGYKSGTYLFQVDHDTHSSFQLIVKE